MNETIVRTNKAEADILTNFRAERFGRGTGFAIDCEEVRQKPFHWHRREGFEPLNPSQHPHIDTRILSYVLGLILSDFVI